MTIEARLIKIGNSRGIRLPKAIINRYGLGDTVLLEERPDGILIHTDEHGMLSWEETYKAMASSDEDWSDWTELPDEENL